MSIALTGSSGFFTRLGHIGYGVNAGNVYRGTTLGTRVNTIRADFNSANQAVADMLYQNLDQARAAMSAWPASVDQVIQQALISAANASNPLSSLTVSVAMQALIDQMVATSQTVQANTVSLSTSYGGSNIGNAVLVASLKNAAGVDQEYVIPEQIVLEAITDSQSYTATAGYETWSIKSPVAVGNLLAWDWPNGSGISASITACPASDGGEQMLVNGEFEDWTTSNIPDNFAILVGTAGSTILRAAVPYQGTYSLSFVGNGSELTSVAQSFNDATGTSVALLPSTIYPFMMKVKMSATPSGGVLAASLLDSSNTVINDDAGTPNTITQDLTAVSTSWVTVSGTFRTPSVMPTQPLKLAIRLTTALQSARTVYVDNATMALGGPLYAGGPWIRVYPGSVPTVKGDTMVLTVSNNWAGQLQTWTQRLFGMNSLGFQLPSSGSPTISDSLYS